MLRRACLTVLALVLLPATVQAFDHHHHHDSDSDGGGGCGSSSEHTSATPAPTATAQRPTPVLSADHKRVFITAAAFAGAVGGLNAADMYCQSAATDAGLPGTYRAWLSSTSTNALDRIDDVGPWYSMRDTVVFSSKSALREAPTAQIVDETGAAPLADNAPWTGTDAQGLGTGQDCEGWTNGTAEIVATTGSGFAADSEWSGGSATLHCDNKAPLICFQQ
ncbi:MAG: hypothetical protein QOI41_2294 [Myxococcales bacterium]|nr:hypothetical protein [Myxococcales bacterium]